MSAPRGRRSVTAIGMIRGLVGMLAFVAPTRAGRIFGLDLRSHGTLIARLFAARNLVRAGEALRGDTEGRGHAAGSLAIDGLDAVAVALALRAGVISRSSAVRLWVAVSTTGALALVDLSTSTGPRVPADRLVPESGR